MSKSRKKITREEYRLRLQHRQTIIFGGISGAMVLSLLLALLFWLGIVPFPFEPEISGSEADGTELVTPCIPANTQAVDMATITVKVYNSTSRTGLASSVGQEFAAMGVAVTDTTNWSQQGMKGSARIIAGQSGIPAAYTIAAHIPGAVVQYDPDVSDEVISVVLAADFERVLSIDEVSKANPGGLLVSQEDCVSIGKGKAR